MMHATFLLPFQIPKLHEALLFGPDGGISKPLRDILEVYVHDPNFEVSSNIFRSFCKIRPIFAVCLLLGGLRYDYDAAQPPLMR